MQPQPKPLFSLVAFACPACAIGIAFASRLIEEEKLGFQVVGIGGICLTVVALLGSIGAFVRKEKTRWFTVLPLGAMFALFGLGVAA